MKDTEVKLSIFKRCFQTCNRRSCRSPSKHDNDDGQVDTSSKNKYGNPSNQLDDESKPNGGQSITNSKDNENSSNNMDTISTGNKTLKSDNIMCKSQ